MSDETIVHLAEARAELSNARLVILELTNKLVEAETTNKLLEKENQFIRNMVNETSIFEFVGAKILAAAFDAGFKIYDRFHK